VDADLVTLRRDGVDTSHTLHRLRESTEEVALGLENQREEAALM
jgi:hypothetical protein